MATTTSDGLTGWDELRRAADQLELAAVAEALRDLRDGFDHADS